MMALRLEVPGEIVDEIKATIDKLLQEEINAAFDAGTIYQHDIEFWGPPTTEPNKEDYLNHIKTKQNESSTGKTPPNSETQISQES
jgi:hypothetical protein